MKKRYPLYLPMLALAVASMGCYVWGPLTSSDSGTAGPVVATASGEEPTQALAPATNTTSQATNASNATQPPPSQPQTDLASIQLELVEVTDAVSHPVDLQNAGDGSGWLFVVEKGGKIQIIENGVVLDEPFLTITDRVGSSGSEQGLLGLAFHPDYETNHQFFVYYTDLNGDEVLSRFTANEDGKSADPGNENIILTQADPASNHNGGQIVFGPDGYLYIGMGDGGGADDTFHNGQNSQSWLGSLLRIDVNQGDPYSVPPDNPFVNDDDYLNEIWAKGLRNPWRFSFDRETGEMYIADVGQNNYEEVDVAPAGQGGQNYGWPQMEGFHCRSGSCDDFVAPVAEYSHNDGCSISGGYVYRGSIYPSLVGTYLFGDYCSGTIWGMRRDANGIWEVAKLLESGLQLSSFGQDEAGELYALDLGGAVYQIQVP